MFQHNYGARGNQHSIHTQLDISNIPADQIQGVLQGSICTHPQQVITLQHGAIPLATLSIDQLSSSRELGLVYHVTVHSDRKGKPAVTFFDQRTELPFSDGPSYLPSGAWCAVKKSISGIVFRLPFLGDIECRLEQAWGQAHPYTILSDTERLIHSTDSSTQAGHYAHLGIGTGKPLNEDAVIISELKDTSRLLAVVDGIGGRGSGLLAARAVASSLACHALCTRSFRKMQSYLPKDLSNTFDDVQGRYPLLTSPRMGAVFAAAKVGRSFFECTHAGDCRVAHFRASRKRTRCVWASEDQISSGKKPTNVLCLEKGIAQPIKLKTARHKIERGDTIILGSDGFWRTVTLKEVERCLHQYPTPSAVGSHLERIINERMQNQRRLRDNFSFAVYRH
jgi:serine/threonine protein phosphatase PrpC